MKLFRKILVVASLVSLMSALAYAHGGKQKAGQHDEDEPEICETSTTRKAKGAKDQEMGSNSANQQDQGSSKSKKGN